MITAADGHAWRDWVLTTSIPLVRIGENDQVLGLATGTMVDYDGHRFVLSVEHAVKRETSGWAIVVQQDDQGRLEFYRPNAFAYAGEFRRSTAAMRLLDLCLAEVSSTLESWYEYRTPRGLFDRRPHHVFQSHTLAEPNSSKVFAFSGQVRHERHSPSTIASDMVVYPGLTYSHTEDEIHHFQLPVNHPGHEAFHGCSGAPIVDLNRHVVALVTGGDTVTNTIKGIAIQRCIPGIRFLVARGSDT